MGDLCPAPTSARRLSRRTTGAGGPDGPPGFFDARVPVVNESRPLPAGARRPGLVQTRGARAMTLTIEPVVTAPLAGPAGSAVPAPPALLIDHVTKTFVVGRHKRPVVAISDVSMRLARGRDLRGARRQRLRQIDAHPPGQHVADHRLGPGRGLRPRHRPRRDGGQAPHQPRQRRRGVLQEALTVREPDLRGPPVRAGREGRQARRGESSWVAWGSPSPAWTGPSSR